ncbi:BlaI/MecI/CopY family transcriptional regulator [candidate division KSB1 bacterium]|nr:BlaI/MecI/CopY family transcriptional regulator [candidate division KSB1 bacterium]
MSKANKLTPVEWELMESVWKLGKRVTAREIHNHTFPHNEKAYTTVQTVLNTMHKKGALTREKIGMVNFYSPAKSRKSMVRDELSNFLSQIFNDSVPTLADFLLDSNQVGLKEIEAFKALIEKKENELRSKPND